MNNLDYLDTKSKSTSNKNLERLSNFFNVEELNRLSMRSVSIVGTKKFIGEGKSKQQAEQDGALKLLNEKNIN